MKRNKKIVTLTILAFLAITALPGGLMLMLAPDGSLMRLPLSELQSAPFSNYLIPGIALFTFLGCGSVASIIALIKTAVVSPFLVFLTGAATTIWIMVEAIMIVDFHWLQVLYLGVGLTLMFLSKEVFLLSRKPFNSLSSVQHEK